MLVYAKELLHSFQSLLFLLVFLFFLYLFVCLFVCFYLRVLPDRMLCLEPWLEHFSNTPFFFSHLIHTCVVNAVDLTIRVAGMLDLFFFFTFLWVISPKGDDLNFEKKNFVEIRVIVLKRSFLTVGRNCTVMRPIIPNKKNNNQRTNSWQKQGFHFLSIIVRWLNLINWQFLKFTPLCSENRCPSWIHFSDPKMNWHYMLTQIYVDKQFCHKSGLQ